MKKIYKFKINLVSLNISAFVVLFLCYIFVIYINKNFSVNFNLFTFILIMLWMGLHEIFHGIGFRMAKGVKSQNVTYGVQLESGIFYCMCKQEINKKDILLSLMFPLIFIGVLTLIIGIILNNSLLILLSIFNISGAVGDIAMFFAIMKMPDDIKYIDLDDTTGFYIISDYDLSKLKLNGVKYDSSSSYEGNLVSSKKKVTISNFSLILFIIVLSIYVLLGIMNFINLLK